MNIKSLTDVASLACLIGCDGRPGKYELRDYVKEHLRDPGSAEFSSDELFRYKDLSVLCGRVNARNAMGGFAGFTQFYAWIRNDRADGEVQFSPSESEPEKRLRFLDQFLLYCRDDPPKL